MRADKLYLAYGLAVLLTLFMGELRGWSFESADEIKDVPKTVRDNPGAYRAHYSSHYRYSGGK